MPTYVYECRTCGKGFEVEQRITEDALTDCDCGAKGGLRRVIQPVGIAFKGAGFHINDYSAAGSSPTSELSASEPAPTTAPEVKTESTPPTSTP